MENIISDTKMNVNLVSMEEIMRLLLGLEEMSSISFPISIEIILVSIVYLKFFKVSLPGFEWKLLK